MNIKMAKLNWERPNTTPIAPLIVFSIRFCKGNGGMEGQYTAVILKPLTITIKHITMGHVIKF